MVFCFVAYIDGEKEALAKDVRVPEAEDVLKILGYSEEDSRAIEGGEIISRDVKRARDDQLIAVVAFPMDASIATIASALIDGRNIAHNPATLAWGEIKTGEIEEFESAHFADGEREEVDALLRVGDNAKFNLSSKEIKFLEQVQVGADSDGSNSAEAVNQAYRRVLYERSRAYRKDGLDGVSPYDQDEDRLTPAKQLRAVELSMKPFLSGFFPDFWESLTRNSSDENAEISSKIYWVKRSVEGRPAFMLIHQLVHTGDGFVLASARQFYVGHTYESLQVFGLALRSENGAIVFSLNSIFTEQITGFFGSVARSVGQSRTRDEMESYMQALRERFGQ